MSNENKSLTSQERRDRMIADRGTKSLQAAIESGVIKRWTAFHCAQDFPAELQDQIVAVVSKMEKAVKSVKALKVDKKAKIRDTAIKAGTSKIDPITSPAVEASKAVAAASVKKATKAELKTAQQAQRVEAQLNAKKAVEQAKQEIEKKTEAAKVGADAILRDEAEKVDMNPKKATGAARESSLTASEFRAKTTVKPSKVGIPLDAPFKSVTEQGFKLVKSPNSIA